MAEKRDNKSTAALLRRQFSNETMRRYLRSLPLFHVNRWLPDKLRESLKRLDRKRK
ncbi:hypothetical protein [Mesorhizobium sp. B2-6-2]|uniref:hypothetical protein n=1 Tax=Mesorhizobium sp. B2-6-2 TaxID=2589915 RepID=UPI0015E38BF4|nr:hypothetical protein [Mesorhizobium sp. B2-6-2]